MQYKSLVNSCMLQNSPIGSSYENNQIFEMVSKPRFIIPMKQKSQDDNVLWFKLGSMSYITEVSQKILHKAWRIAHLMENKEIDDYVIVISRGRIPSYGQDDMWDSLDPGTANGSWFPNLRTSRTILWR